MSRKEVHRQMWGEGYQEADIGDLGISVSMPTIKERTGLGAGSGQPSQRQVRGGSMDHNDAKIL